MTGRGAYLVSALALFLPWRARRLVLQALLGYELHPEARIGFSLVAPGFLKLGRGAWIGHLTVCKGLDRMVLEEDARIGNLNWVTGLSTDGGRGLFPHAEERRSEFILREGAAVTLRHLFDCNDRIEIGRFTTIGGYRTQALTHYIDVATSRQTCAPIEIDDYCYVATGCIMLPGSRLPAKSILSAGSLLNKSHSESGGVYGGVPARRLKDADPKAAYFSRPTPRVE
jgi:acetyltransferase-like isoleucine patch superfamily enzyme